MPLPTSNPQRKLQVHRVDTGFDGVHLAVHEWPSLQGRQSEETLVLVHCTGTHSRVWDWYVDRLPDTWRVVAVDMRGHGISDNASAPYRWSHRGRDLATVFSALGVQHALGVGHSAGGHAIASSAVLDSGLFKSLLLLDPVIQHEGHYTRFSGGYPEDAPEGAMVRNALRRKGTFESPEEMFHRFAQRLPYKHWNKAVLADYVFHGLAHDGPVCHLRCAPETEASVYASECLPDANIRPLLRSIASPVHLVRAVGGGGAPAGPSSPDLASLLPNVRDTELATGHFFPQERPAEVLDMIRQLATAPSSARL